MKQFRAARTLIMLFDIFNPRTGEIYSKDPRQVAKKAERYLSSTGIADTAFFAPEAEFFIFEDVRYESSPRGSFYAVDSDEAWWNASREDEGGNLSHKTGLKGGYFGVLHTYPSELAQTFYTAIAAFVTCIVVTAVISLVTRPRPAEELHGLVSSLTPRPRDEGLPFFQRPVAFAGVVLALTLILNLAFR